MSATSEELTAQAEELQTSLAFFQTANANHGRANLSQPDAAQLRKAAPAKSTRKLALEQTVPAQQARAKGFALNMAMGGPDSEDKYFHQDNS